MSKMHVTVPHSLSETEAVSRIRTLLQQVRQQYGDKISDVHEQWNGNTGNFRFSAMGSTIEGLLEVTPSEVRIDGTLPMAASFFKGAIERTIRERATQLLAYSFSDSRPQITKHLLRRLVA